MAKPTQYFQESREIRLFFFYNNHEIRRVFESRKIELRVLGKFMRKDPKKIHRGKIRFSRLGLRKLPADKAGYYRGSRETRLSEFHGYYRRKKVGFPDFLENIESDLPFPYRSKSHEFGTYCAMYW